ncbi:gliding motility protein RemB [Salinimicrobium sp. GXAS 041]|uniref:gliding motility protein RemB n=1 Tax=Salinimicrobium sp. GXAS 041 TaxID=3400806 RepID=UPI003C711B3D
MKYFRLLIFLSFISGFSQTPELDAERFPIFPECNAVTLEQEENCFKTTLKKRISEEFILPESLAQENFAGNVIILFGISKNGVFTVNYINAPLPQIDKEMRRVFAELPAIAPPTYNGRPVNMQFRVSVEIPMKTDFENNVNSAELVQVKPTVEEEQDGILTEYDQIESLGYNDERVESELNIPLSHEWYNRFDDEVNRIGTNFHTSSKPFLFSQVQPYYDFVSETEKLRKPVKSWFGRKLWNEHLITFKGEDYWFTADFALDLQLGKDFGGEHDVTYNNTRAAIFQGGLGKNFNFYTVLYENQGRFADYYNRFAESIRPENREPATIPGRGIAKEFMGDAYDYPVAEGYLSYSPGKFFNLQFGHGKNFIGDGYRSLLLSDNATPYPYFKLNTTFWKLKYTNTWMSLRDVRQKVTGEGSFRTKYMANHYLSYNVTKRLNLGFFESVMWEDDNNRGFDLNYLNPVIFYRAIEFSTGARAGNAIIGLSGKYKWSDHLNLYTQFLIDEFSSGDIFGGEGSWKNKLGFQFGMKYFNAFNVENLYFQLEYNQVRPYTYSHNTITLNYGHNNQSMAHLWGANFREIVAISRYRYGRFYGHSKLIYGKRGFDFNTAGDDLAYGGDIYTSEYERAYETGVEIGQGNTTNSFFSETEAGYIINPATNLKLYGNFIFRSFNPEVNTSTVFQNDTFWLNFGIRTDIFNWYYDY